MLPRRLHGIPSAFAPANTHSQSYARDAGQCSIHCKSIHALSVTKRGLPAPPLRPHVGVAAEYDAAREDDEFYATHTRIIYCGCCTEGIASPSSSPRRTEPSCASAARAPPIDTLSAVVNVQLRLNRPPPRTPVPTDARSGDYSYVYSRTFVLELHASPTSSTSSPSPRSFQAQVPADVLDAEEWEECDVIYEEVTLSPRLRRPHRRPPPMNLPRAPPPAHPPALSCNFVDWPLSSPSSPRLLIYNSAPILAPCSCWSIPLSSLCSAHARSSKAFLAPRAIVRWQGLFRPVAALLIRLPRRRGKDKSGKRLTTANVFLVLPLHPFLPRSCYPLPPMPAPPPRLRPRLRQWAAYPTSPALYTAYASSSASPSNSPRISSPRALHRLRDAALAAPRVDGGLGLQRHLLALAFPLQLRTFLFRALGVRLL
ncbi:hypothetical protein C8R44DRAFT_990728 [Mycena epipterygia]|nr:hypothetical protein C8R44DRAFT_990728 [Mycena epipterygia]